MSDDALLALQRIDAALKRIETLVAREPKRAPLGANAPHFERLSAAAARAVAALDAVIAAREL